MRKHCVHDRNILGTALSIKIFTKIGITWPCQDTCHLLIEDCLRLAWQLMIKDVYLPSSIAQISFITFLYNPSSPFILCRALDIAWLKHNPWSKKDHGPQRTQIHQGLAASSQRRTRVSPNVGLPSVSVLPTRHSRASSPHSPTQHRATTLFTCPPTVPLLPAHDSSVLSWGC